jgi:hypothetical protein
MEKNPEKSFYTFGLFTDDSLQYLHPVANTEEGLDSTVKYYNEEVDPEYNTTSTHKGMRWAYGDWEFFPDVSEGDFDEINEILVKVFDSEISDKEFEKVCSNLSQAILNGFKRLVEGGLFDRLGRENITFLLVGNVNEDFSNLWVREINLENVANSFENWQPG